MLKILNIIIVSLIVIALVIVVNNMFFSVISNITLTSSKPIKPIVKIKCIEVDGSKECDTTYTYKK